LNRYVDYVGTLIRPPSEAGSLILQVTVGCPYNRCTFCGAYRAVPFRVKSPAILAADLAEARSAARPGQRLFLADGDVLGLPQERLLAIFHQLRSALPGSPRISLYGSARAVLGKGPTRLDQLRDLGLDRIYLGLESGSDEVLRRVAKGVTAAQMVAAAEMARQSGLFLSVTALLGLGGTELSAQHADATARVLSAMAPQQIALLTLMPLAGTPLAGEIAAGRFTLPEPAAILAEMYRLVAGLERVRCQFHANHASSYLPLAGRLPRDQKALLQTIDEARRGCRPLVPDYWRAL
jgi:radical SAM superfamily enzyme YgiQ (UPF0313 family)